MSRESSEIRSSPNKAALIPNCGNCTEQNLRLIAATAHLPAFDFRPAPGDGTARRIPGRSDGEPMNSMPAASSAAFTSRSVDERLGGTSSAASNRLIVRLVTPALSASFSLVQRRAFRAARICAPVIIDFSPIVPYSDTIVT